MEDLPWPPQPVPEPVKKLILRFYTSIDSHGPHASYKLASKVFTADGELIINKRVWSGSESICQWRAGGDNVIMRSHTINEILISGDDGSNVFMSGTLRLGSEVGLIAESPFSARCLVDDTSSHSPRVKKWQIWMVELITSIYMSNLANRIVQDYTPFFDLGILRPPASKMSDGVLDTIGGR
ncbi:hypothetical protein D0869_15180 [Hortaea werneckii]|uniref:Uncharacterized protein n=1 Tax=Hortaea werneckii TaxID=91943 RepID=A0A3M6ZR22_HORWE|nr:hypothetical protein D0869_15180 [Hortaea werneckii]RMX82825.1 hypothetical protein D0868_15758 [Hortaea werneckii]RMX95830.1 hypothetical protein D0867_13358 [Hortaea werneckii]RMY17642.1 hypothetical protein D0866_13408 [Hortaea werneckii]